MKLTYLPDIEQIKIIPDNNYELRGIKNWLNRYVENYMFDPAYKMKLWNGKRSFYNKEEDLIPLGLWKEAYKCCEEFGYTFEFTNKDEFPLNRNIKKKEFIEFINNFFKDYDYLPREYQLDAAYNILKNRYCNIAVATSGGKTLIYALVLFYLLKNNPRKKFLLVVPSKTLVTQFYNDIIAFNYKNEIDINCQEIFGDEEKPRVQFPDKEPNFVIATFQSLTHENIAENGKKIKKFPKEWFKQFWSITTDEAHRGVSKSYSKKILKYTLNNAYYRWGMSGSYPAESTYEMLEIMSKTGPVVSVVKAKKLMVAGYITKVKIKGILMYHNDWEFAQQIEIISNRDKKAAYDLECAKIQESDERINLINKIVKQCDSNTLVLFHNTDYGKKLLEILQEKNPDKDFHYIDGKINNKKRSIIKKEMEKTDGNVQILIASFATLSTGVSINAITNIIFTQSFKKPHVIIQSIGRALRLHQNKKMAYIFDLVDIFNHDDFSTRIKSKFKNILYSHWDKRQKVYIDEEYPYSFIEFQLKPSI